MGERREQCKGQQGNWRTYQDGQRASRRRRDAQWRATGSALAIERAGRAIAGAASAQALRRLPCARCD